MRTAIEQREEFAVDMKHHNVAAIDGNHLVAAGRDIRGAGDDVAGHLIKNFVCDQSLYNARALPLKILARSASVSGVLNAKRGSSKSQCG
jgi:hypothetical protein